MHAKKDFLTFTQYFLNFQPPLMIFFYKNIYLHFWRQKNIFYGVFPWNYLTLFPIFFWRNISKLFFKYFFYCFKTFFARYVFTFIITFFQPIWLFLRTNVLTTVKLNGYQQEECWYFVIPTNLPSIQLIHRDVSFLDSFGMTALLL